MTMHFTQGNRDSLQPHVKRSRFAYWDDPLPGRVGFRPIEGPKIDREFNGFQYVKSTGNFLSMLRNLFNSALLEEALGTASVNTLTEAAALMDATGDPGVLIEINVLASAPDPTGAQIRIPHGSGMRVVGSGIAPFQTAVLEAAHPRAELEGIPDGYRRDPASSSYVWLKRDPLTGESVYTTIAPITRKLMTNEVSVLRWDGELVRQLGNAETIRTVAEIASAAIVRAGTQEQRNAMAALRDEIAATRAALMTINSQLNEELQRQAKLAEQARVWQQVGAIANFAASLGTLLNELGVFAPEGLPQAATKEDVQAMLDGALAKSTGQVGSLRQELLNKINDQNTQIRNLNDKLSNLHFDFRFESIIEIQIGPNGTVLP